MLASAYAPFARPAKKKRTGPRLKLALPNLSRFFHKEPLAKPLTNPILDHLVRKHYVAEEKARQLLFLQREGRYAHRPVTYLRVFDPAFVEGEAMPQSYHGVAGRGLLFELRVEKGQPLRVKDLRVCLLHLKPSPEARAYAEASIQRRVNRAAGHQDGFTPD
jgi:hypothetical protein